MDAIGNQHVKVTIIVPVYMAEPYLEKCLRSAMNQTVKEIEILAINDCSPDQSMLVLQRLQNEDKRIRIIDFPQNRGVSNARNTGIREANGEYVMFLDSDDYLEQNAVSLLLEKMRGGDDAARATVIKEDEQGNFIAAISPGCKEPIIKLYGFSAGIYRRESLIKMDNWFPNYKIGEDWLFMLKMCLLAERICYIDAPVYHWISYTRPFNSHKYDDSKTRFDRLRVQIDMLQMMLKSDNDSYDMSVIGVLDHFLHFEFDVHCKLKGKRLSDYCALISQLNALCESSNYRVPGLYQNRVNRLYKNVTLHLRLDKLNLHVICLAVYAVKRVYQKLRKR